MRFIFGGQNMRYAVVDAGSNTIRLGIYEYENGKLNIIYNKAVFANLAGYINNNILTLDGMVAASKAIKIHQKAAENYGCKLNVFATAAIRNAGNTEEICSEILRLTGEEIDVLSGEDEAVLSFIGAKDDFPCKDGVMADVGGGSSEIIPFKNKTPHNFFSVPWGSLKTFKRFVKGTLPTEDEINNIKAEMRAHLKSTEKFDNLCIVGGGVDASAKLTEKFLGEKSISVSGLKEIIDIVINKPDYAKKIIQKTAPERLETIIPGIAIYSALSEFFSSKNIYISDKGIKEGYILNKLV